MREADESARLRVLMILESNFSQQGGGGAESQVRSITLGLRRLGHKVAVLTPMFPWGPQVAVERSRGVPVGRLRYPQIKVIGGVIMYLRFAGFLWKNRNRYDAWHAHIGHYMAAITCLVGDWLDKPVVLKLSGSWEREQGLLAPGRGPFARLLGGWLKRATTVQAISTRIAAELVRDGFPAERVLVLPNAVDTARFELRARPRGEGARLEVVFVGRLVEEKGLTTLFDAWARAFAQRGQARLRLVGGGPLEQPLKEQAAALGVAHQIEFLGHRDRVEDVLAESHLGVLTSRVEGLSNTLLEFMSCGLPMVASRVSGSEDFVKAGRNGWLFEVGDVDALARCLSEAAALPGEKLAELGRNARTDVEAAAGMARVTGRLTKLYRKSELREVG
jgi:L-malate glycosyltransferase